MNGFTTKVAKYLYWFMLDPEQILLQRVFGKRNNFDRSLGEFAYELQRYAQIANLPPVTENDPSWPGFSTFWTLKYNRH